MPGPEQGAESLRAGPLRNQVSANAHKKLGVIPRWEHSVTAHTDRQRCDGCNPE